VVVEQEDPVRGGPFERPSLPPSSTADLRID
jgi:hypothetical protein